MRNGLVPALALLALFCGLGWSFARLTGLHYDETFFAAPLYAPHEYERGIDTPAGRVPVLVTRTQGALKTWLWGPWLKLAGAGVGAVRLPALAAAALAAWLFFLALRRMAGVWAAVLGLALLATDGNYLLTSLYDAGPLALQHLLWCGALYAGVRFVECRGAAWAAAGCACVGLAFWDRPPDWSYSAAAIVPGIKKLDQALSGGGLAGFLTVDGSPLTMSGQAPLLAAVLLALPAFWFSAGGRRLVWFAAAGAACAVAVAASPDGGLAIYQPLRLWPLPQLLIALAAAEALRLSGGRARKVLAAALVLAALSNLIPLYQLRQRLVASGPAVAWTRAAGELMQELGRHPGRVVFAAEWGILRQIHLMSQGRIGLVWHSDVALARAGEAWSGELLHRAFTQPETLFVSHAPESEIVPGTLAKLDALAAGERLRRRVLREIVDERGRPVFLLFDYRREP